jgi:predicted dehydrogenase
VPSKRISRRRFVQNSLAAAAAASIARPQTIRAVEPSISANSKLNVAFIGTFNQAASDFDQITGTKKVNVVALCDIDDDKIDLAMEKPQCENAKRFNDYREMLDKIDKDIDAVMVAIPDNQHFHAAMHAIKRGKHVYVEKPLCHDAWEARQLTQLAHEKGVVTQMGTQIHGGDNYRRVVEKIQSGAIGKVTRAHCWVEGAWVADAKPISPPPKVPDAVNWDLWIGPAPMREYHPRLHPYFWRGWWDFGGGRLADMACHHMDLPTWALGLTAPTKIESQGPDPDRESGPAWQIVDYHYPAVGDRGPVHLTWYHGDKRPPQFKEGKLPKWGDGTLFEGEKGMLLASYHEHKLLPEETFKDYKAPEPTIPNSIGHYAEWVQACLDNKPAATTCKFEYGGPLTEAVLLGVVAHRLGNVKLDWDSPAFRCTNNTAAEKFLKREYRKGWEV